MSYDSNKLPNCMDCGAKLSAPHVKRCVTCNAKSKIGTISPKRIPGYEREGNKLKMSCSRCGADAWVAVGNRKMANHYCSVECRSQSFSEQFNKRETRSCLKCGNAFVVPLAWTKKGRGRFCSQYCARHFSGETFPEGNIRKALVILDVPFMQEHKIGRYRIDFFLPESSTILEVDAPYWHEPDAEKDQLRDDWMRSQGFHVIRILTTDYSSDDIADIAARLASELHDVHPRSGVV